MTQDPNSQAAHYLGDGETVEMQVEDFCMEIAAIGLAFENGTSDAEATRQAIAEKVEIFAGRFTGKDEAYQPLKLNAEGRPMGEVLKERFEFEEPASQSFTLFFWMLAGEVMSMTEAEAAGDLTAEGVEETLDALIGEGTAVLLDLPDVEDEDEDDA